MASHNIAIIAFLFAMCASSTISNHVNYFYIVPSLNVSCPQEPCLTLSQFADNVSWYNSRNGNVSLVFQPGNHSLVVELFVINALNFSMTANVQSGIELAFVNCIGQSERFCFKDSNFVWIKGLHFIGCRSTEVIQVRQFVLEDATFLGVSFVRWGSSSLILHRVANASIIRNSFLLNHNNYASHGGAIYANDSSFSIVDGYFANNSASLQGGAVYSLNSTFTITTSNFADNRAPNGGVIYASASLFNILSSNFINNTASCNGAHCTFESSIKERGGVLYAHNSSFSIGFSTFIRNRADDTGGVLYVETDSLFDIATSIFTHNSASNEGGVMYIYHSSFSFVNNTIELNSAAKHGGVMYILWSSFACNITASTFTKNYAHYSGGVIFTRVSRIRIFSSTFIDNIADNGGVIFITWQSSLSIINSSFMVNNASRCGGAICVALESSFSISASNFTKNGAPYGGAISIEKSTFNITTTNFTENNAFYSGGALYVQWSSSCGITSSRFIKNRASYGAVLFLYDKSSLQILTSTFDNNGDHRIFDNTLDNSEFESRSQTNEVTCSGKLIAKIIGDTLNECSIHSGVIASIGSSFSITNCNFTNNHARLGVMTAFKSHFSITNSTYANNQAKIGGVMSAFNASFNISNSLFRENFAKLGGVAGTFESSFSIVCSKFINNEAYLDGGAMYIVSTVQDFNVTITNSIFSKNKANYGGILYSIGTTVDMMNSNFYQNTGSFYAFSCNVTFRGITRFEDGSEPPLKHHSKISRQEGGAITSYHSTVTFMGASTLLNNQARKGGAILAIDSDIIMWNETIIANNVAANGSGGGIYLIQCDFYIHGTCNFIQNCASVKGGGVYASGSSIVVQQQGDLRFTNNSAQYGGGAYLGISSRLVTFSKFPGILSKEGENGFVTFVGNNANYGGAIYIADINSVLCFFSIECFIQSVSFNKLLSDATIYNVSTLIAFSGNTATCHGSNILGGLFDRCIPSPFATVYTDDVNPIQYYSGIDYLRTISNITLDSIASDPVQVCFCNSTDQPDCSYEMPIIRVRKGEAFNVTVVAVDQVNRSVNASIRGLLINQAHGRMGKGQQLQPIRKNCTNLTYNVFSPDDSEIIMLFADGPCMGSVLSRRKVSIQFLNCTCSIGFEPSSTNSKCECVCDSTLSPYVTDCDSATSSILRANMNSWITFTNDTDPPGFIVYPVCPLDYCYPPSENVSMNLNLPSGSDAQCAHNRSGILCGACQPNLSLSLGSSRCLPCPKHWPLIFISITVAAIIAGILLVTMILVLNLTVADGMINAIIFFADVTAPFDRIVHSSTAPSFPTVFVAWLNLDIGFDVCFFKGLDVYAKTWLQLAFPVYIISLVAIVIEISKYSPRFTRLISSRRRDPVASLATLVLLSYAKLLSTTISVLSFATPIYPDGSKSMVWLADGNVQYLRGKHIALVIVVIFIVLIGVPYTFCLFSWQWLIRIPKIKVNRWTKLNSIITAYHAPYNNKHRYWTGLLLVVRIVLYITVAITVSNNPQIPLLMTTILVGGLLFLKGIVGTRLYTRSSVDIVETIILLNLLLFSAFSWYNFKADSRKETAITYISTSTVFLLLIGEIVFNISLSIGCKVKKKSLDRDGHAQLLQPLVHSSSLLSEVTHSSIEISIPTPSPNKHGRDDFESENESSFVK